MLKWVAGAIAAITLLLIAAVATVPYLVDTPRVQSLVAASASQALGRRVQFSGLSVSMLPLPSVKLRDLQVSEDPRFGASPFLTVETGTIGLRIWPLLSGRLEFTDLVLRKPQVALLRDRTGRFNIATLGSSPDGVPSASAARGPGRAATAATALPVISRIRIADGIVRYESLDAAGGKTSYALGDLNLLLEGGGPTAPVEIKGQARLADGDLRLKFTEVRVSGKGVRGAGDAALTGRVVLDGKDIGALASRVVGPVPQLAGPFKGTLALGGTLAAPSASGELELPQLSVSESRPACAEPRRRTLTFQSVRLPILIDGGMLTVRPFTTTLHGGKVSSAVALDLREAAVLRLRETAIFALPLAPVLVDYLCQGYAITGPLDLVADLAARPSSLLASLSGSGRLRIGPGQVVGSQAVAMLGAMTRVAQTAVAPGERTSRAPIDFDSITASYVIDAGVARSRDFTFTSRLMKLTAAGEYRLSDGRMNLDVGVIAGRAQLRAQVTGTAASPSIRIDPSGLLQSPGVEQGIRDLLQRLR